jgi:hypothetical protein
MTNSHCTSCAALGSRTAEHGKETPRAPPGLPDTRPAQSRRLQSLLHASGVVSTRPNNAFAWTMHLLMLDSLRCNCCGQTATTQGKREQTILPPSPLLSLATGSSTGSESYGTLRHILVRLARPGIPRASVVGTLPPTRSSRAGPPGAQLQS